MAIIGIVAIASNFPIGRGGKLPWHYSADLRFFKETTTGNAVVMGSNTWASIGKPLPNRLNIVLSRSDLATPDEVLVFHKRNEVAALTKYLRCDAYIIGGAKVFETFADVIEKWIVTEVPETIDDADVFMPATFLDDFEETGSEGIGQDLKIRRFQRK